MAKPKGLVVSESEISQEIDLKALTGVDVGKDPVLRREITQAMIDYMKGRTSEHLGVGRKPWRNTYSDEYANSLDFKAAGKSDNDVNLELSGDMIGSIDVAKEKGSVVKLAIVEKSQIPKAYGHITGFEGHPTIKNGSKYKRNFFGLTDEELKDEILVNFESEIEELKDKQIVKTKDSQGELIKTLRKASDFFQEEE